MAIRFPKMILSFPLFALAAFLCFFGAGRAHAEESYRLKNGLTVILAERPGAGVVSGRLSVKAGSSDEKDFSEYGLAHLLEHMAFKSTAKYSKGDISKLVEENGGSLNAYTNYDLTNYQIDLPSESVALMLDLFADMVFAPAYKPDELEEEKEVVVEEIRMYRDDPDWVLYQDFRKLQYGDHPYGRPIIGSEQSVKGVTREAIKNYHDRNYRPDNAVLVVAGEFDTGEAKRLIESDFGSVQNPAGPLAKAPEGAPERLAAPRVSVQANDQANLAKVFIGFPGFRGDNGEALRSDMLGGLLSGGRASRLVENVKQKKELVTSIGAYMNIGADAGQFVISLETTPDKMAAAVAATLDELKGVLSNPPTAAEVARARALLKKSELGGQDDSGGVAEYLGFYEVLFGGWRWRDAYAGILDDTDADTLVGMMSQLLAGSKMTIAAMVPKVAEASVPGYTAELERLATNFSPPEVAQVAAAAPHFEEMPPVNGVRLLVMRDPSRQMVDVVAGVRGGLLAETAGDNGISSLMASVWPKATKDRKAAELARAVEDLGATIGSVSGGESARLTGVFVKDTWRDGLKLFAEVLTKPAFDPADVEEERRDTLAAIDQRDENLAGRVRHMADAALYADHPRSLEVLGQRETVESFTPEDLATVYHDTIMRGELVIAVAGDVHQDEVRAILAATLDPWRPAAAVRPFRMPPAPKPLEKSIVATKAEERNQTHLVLAFDGPAKDSPDRPALSVLFGHLNGMGGVLFMELREKRSLAYTVYADPTFLTDGGDLKFYIACDPSKVQEALAGMRDIVTDLVEKGVTPEETEASKRFLVGNTKIGTQPLMVRTVRAMDNVLSGLGLDFSEKNLEAVKAVTAEDVNRVAKKYLRLDRSVVAALGSEASLKAVGAAEPAAPEEKENAWKEPALPITYLMGYCDCTEPLAASAESGKAGE